MLRGGFMNSKCIVCGKELKSHFLTLTDGKCCKDCWTNAGIEDVPYVHADSRIYSSYDLQKFSEFKIQQETLKNNFHPTKTIYYNTGGIEFDDKTMTFRITRFGQSGKKFCIFRYDQYSRCAIEQDVSKHTSVDLGRAALGETLLGERGWWLGALSNITTSTSCNSLGVKIELKDCPMDSIYIPLIDSDTSGKNRKYASANANANAIEEQLNRCRKRVREEQESKYAAERVQREQEIQEQEAKYEAEIAERERKRQEREAEREAERVLWEQELRNRELKRKKLDEEIARLERESQEIDRRMEERRKLRAEQAKNGEVSGNGSGFSVRVRVREVDSDENKEDSKTLSAADEILKFKQLLDAGIITEEEFQAKKKQLLGL